MCNYREASTDFVSKAYELLDAYKQNLLDIYRQNPQSALVGSAGGVKLNGPYILKINKKGRLSVCKICKLHSEYEYLKVIGHSFNEKYSQITYVGKLLAVYLEDLQLEEG